MFHPVAVWLVCGTAAVFDLYAYLRARRHF
jgi:hypothetical protein